jgi:hypothetical protein
MGLPTLPTLPTFFQGQSRLASPRNADTRHDVDAQEESRKNDGKVGKVGKTVFYRMISNGFGCQPFQVRLAS